MAQLVYCNKTKPERRHKCYVLIYQENKHEGWKPFKWMGKTQEQIDMYYSGINISGNQNHVSSHYCNWLMKLLFHGISGNKNISIFNMALDKCMRWLYNRGFFVVAGNKSLSFRRIFLFCVTMPIHSTNSRTFCPGLWLIIWEGLVSFFWIVGKVQKSLWMQQLDCVTVSSVKNMMSACYRKE